MMLSFQYQVISENQVQKPKTVDERRNRGSKELGANFLANRKQIEEALSL